MSGLLSSTHLSVMIVRSQYILYCSFSTIVYSSYVCWGATCWRSCFRRHTDRLMNYFTHDIMSAEIFRACYCKAPDDRCWIVHSTVLHILHTVVSIHCWRIYVLVGTTWFWMDNKVPSVWKKRYSCTRSVFEFFISTSGWCIFCRIPPLQMGFLQHVDHECFCICFIMVGGYPLKYLHGMLSLFFLPLTERCSASYPVCIPFVSR